MMGMRLSWVYMPVLSPVNTKAISTVKIGAELFTVSVNDTSTYFRASTPRNTVQNLKQQVPSRQNCELLLLLLRPVEELYLPQAPHKDHVLVEVRGLVALPLDWPIHATGEVELDKATHSCHNHLHGT